MAVTLKEVQPGDLITAALWNSLLVKFKELETKVQQLSGSIPTGMMTVPDVFGHKLSDAKAIIAMPSQQLGLGFVVDAFGKIIDPSLQASGALIVIAQAPAPGTKANPGSSVSLAVSASGGSTSQPPPVPKIKGFEPNPAPVGSEVLIGGEAFAANPKDNVVTFDGVPAGTPTKSTGNTLRVIVPSGIKGAPVKPDDKTKPNVKVVVKVGDKSAEGLCDISAPLSEKPVPKIETITPSPGVVSKDKTSITITGLNFSPDKKANFVKFSGTPKDGVNPDTATEKQLVVAVPKEIAGFIPESGVPQPFDVTVTTAAGTSNTKSHEFVKF